MVSTKSFAVLSTPEYASLADKIKLKLNSYFSFASHVSIETKTFSDGERYHRISDCDFSNKEVVLVGGTINDAAILDMYNLACTLVTLNTKKLHIVIPYFGYSTMERATKSGEVVKAKNIAKLFSGISSAIEGNFIYIVDAHTEGLPYYFEGPYTHVKHVYAKPIIKDMLSSIAPLDSMVLASTDAGRAKWVESLANDFGMQAAFLLKRRSGETTTVTAINADVSGKSVVIYDDMIRSGSSVTGAATSYLEAGALNVFACCTHGVFTPDSNRLLSDSSNIAKILCTDTHFNATQLNCKKLSVFSIADQLALEIRGQF